MRAAGALVRGACAALALAEVAAWTVDLGSVRRFFDNQKRQEEYQQHLNNYYGEEFDDYEGAPEGPRGQYAEEYGYEGYMERKVHAIVRKGGKYLDGLRRAMETYKHTLENCSSLQLVQIGANASHEPLSGAPPGNRSRAPSLGPSAAVVAANASAAGGVAARAAGAAGAAPGAALSGAELQRVRCANATRERQHVRRLVDLALHTTRQLQERAVKQMIYAGHPGHDGEEKELIIRLAWFLDRLAHITGYEPEASAAPDDAGKTSSAPGAPAVTAGALALPPGVREQVLECIKRNSSLPAALRCGLPLQLQPLLADTLRLTAHNGTAVNSTVAVVDGARAPPGVAAPKLPAAEEDKQASNLLETLLIVTDMWSKLPPVPRSPPPRRAVRKRALADPAQAFVNYYLKQRAWAADNTRPGAGNDCSVDNRLPKAIDKRSDAAGQRYLLRRPKDQHHKVSHGKFKASGARVAPAKPDARLGRYLAKIRSALASKSMFRKLRKPFKHAPLRAAGRPVRGIGRHAETKPGARAAASGALPRRFAASYDPRVLPPHHYGIIETVADI